MHPDTTPRPSRTARRVAGFVALATAGLLLLSTPAGAGPPRPAAALGPCVAVPLPGGGFAVSLPCGDPCEPVGPRCDPVPPPCPPLAPTPASADPALTFAPCPPELL